MIAMGLELAGCPKPRCRPAATLILSSVRGLLLHVLTTGDRAAADAAIEELILAMELQLPPPSAD